MMNIRRVLNYCNNPHLQTFKEFTLNKLLQRSPPSMTKAYCPMKQLTQKD